MEIVIEHAVEPEIAVPAPRLVSLPLRSSLLLIVALLLLGSFVIGSGGALWEGTKLAWLACRGQTVSARIVEIRTDPVRQKGQPPRQAAIRYAGVIPGPHDASILQTGWISLGASAALPGPEQASLPEPTGPVSPRPLFRIGEAVPLRCAVFGGLVFSQPWGQDPASRIGTLFLVGGLVMAVSLRLLRRLARWIQSRLYLLRQGTATIGTITHTRSEAEDMVRYFLRYGYAIGGGESREHEEQVSADQWRLFHVGQPVTVLYDPKQPERAGLYALIGKH